MCVSGDWTGLDRWLHIPSAKCKLPPGPDEGLSRSVHDVVLYIYCRALQPCALSPVTRQHGLTASANPAPVSISSWPQWPHIWLMPHSSERSDYLMLSILLLFLKSLGSLLIKNMASLAQRPGSLVSAVPAARIVLLSCRASAEPLSYGILGIPGRASQHPAQGTLSGWRSAWQITDSIGHVMTGRHADLLSWRMDWQLCPANNGHSEDVAV